jgi:hypothetical protein
MIKTICSERQVSWNRNSGSPWSLSIFHTIKCENHDISTPLGNDLAVPLYKYEVMEQKWEGILELSTSHVWMIAKIPFKNAGVDRLLRGLWLTDDVIDAYLALCACLRPDIKFLPTLWFPWLARWGLDASRKSASWVSLPFIFIKPNSIAAGAQILKNEANVEAAMKKFTAVIAIIHHPQHHWVTLQFDPKKEILEVFDSMAPKLVESRMEKIGKVRFPTIASNIF